MFSLKILHYTAIFPSLYRWKAFKENPIKYSLMTSWNYTPPPQEQVQQNKFDFMEYIC